MRVAFVKARDGVKAAELAAKLRDAGRQVMILSRHDAVDVTAELDALNIKLAPAEEKALERILPPKFSGNRAERRRRKAAWLREQPRG